MPWKFFSDKVFFIVFESEFVKSPNDTMSVFSSDTFLLEHPTVTSGIAANNAENRYNLNFIIILFLMFLLLSVRRTLPFVTRKTNFFFMSA